MASTKSSPLHCHLINLLSQPRGADQVAYADTVKSLAGIGC
jgi:hypothetical protein